jgi:hypothetical protein
MHLERSTSDFVQQGTADQYASTGVGGTRKGQPSVVRDLPLVFGRPVILHKATFLLSDHQIANSADPSRHDRF